MGYKREEITDFTPMSLKKINDNFRYMWLKAFKNISFSDMDDDLKANIEANAELSNEVIELRNRIESSLSMFYQAEIPNTSMPLEVTLPAMYAGTDFKVMLSLKKVSSGDYVKEINLECTSKDTVNGSFIINCYAKDSTGTKIPVDVIYTIMV